MNNKTIKVEIEIEKEISTGVRGVFHIHDLIFTDFDRLLNYDELRNNLKTALSSLKGFTMLTINLIERPENDYNYNRNYLLTAYRFLYGRNDTEITIAKQDFDSFHNWRESDKKELFSTLKEIVDYGNKRYIELIKENALQTL